MFNLLYKISVGNLQQYVSVNFRGYCIPTAHSHEPPLVINSFLSISYTQLYLNATDSVTYSFLLLLKQRW